MYRFSHFRQLITSCQSEILTSAKEARNERTNDTQQEVLYIFIRQSRKKERTFSVFPPFVLHEGNVPKPAIAPSEKKGFLSSDIDFAAVKRYGRCFAAFTSLVLGGGGGFCFFPGSISACL